MVRRFLLVSGLMLFGCASAQRNLQSGASSQPAGAERSQAQKANASPEVVCGMEAPTGSLIVRRVCRRVDDIERERVAAQEFVRSHGATPRPKDVTP